MASVYPVLGNDPAYPPGMGPVNPVMGPINPGMGPPNTGQWMAQNYVQGGGGGGGAVNDRMEGLECLDDRDMVRIEKLYDDYEEITGVSQPRKFKVLNDGSKQLFSMEESKAKMSSRSLTRAFQVNCKDTSGETVFKIIRDTEKSCAQCFFCCTCCGTCRTDAKVKVGSKIIGNIGQNCSVKSPAFSVYRGEDRDVTLLRIDGFNTCMEMCRHYELRYPGDDRVVGTLKKKGSGYGNHENTYYVHFPASCDRNLKIMCIAAMVLFDYRFHYVYRGESAD